MALTKSTIIEEISKQLIVTPAEAKDLVENLLEIMKIS